MNKVYMLPTPTQASQDTSNAINQIVLKLQKHLPACGWEITENRDEADLVAGHAGQTDGTPCDVAHVHGLYPTHRYPQPEYTWAANAHVLKNVRDAREVTVPSQWVADIFRRDMHLSPHVIGWAIDYEDWSPGDNLGYVLWNKTRAEGVCDPTPLNELAKRLPEQKFVTTFGEPRDNVMVIGRQPYERMKPIVQGAGVYLATTRETFGIGTLEAMACGIPILGYNWAGTADIVQHGINGFLAEPGDIDGLVAGLAYCQQYRDALGSAAREAASTYTWAQVAERFALIYNKALFPPDYKLSVIVPVYNYARFVGQAIESVKAQQTTFEFEILVVDDGSTDDSARVALDALSSVPNGRLIPKKNGGPSSARNAGIRAAKGEYILCLDADDLLGDPGALQIMADTLDADRSIGITYTGLRMFEGEQGSLTAPLRYKDSPWPSSFNFEEQLARHNQVPTCCMFRKEAWARAGGYRRAYEPAEDAELWTHITALGYGAKQATQQPWFWYRVHADSLSAGQRNGTLGEPDWLNPHRHWIESGLRPCAAPPIPMTPYVTSPVKDYDQPLFSIIIPVGKGHEKYLPDALDSVAAQSDWRWECIVVFDQDYVHEPGLWEGYSWIKWLWADDPPRGPGHARNVGAKAARGQFLVFLDADDVLNRDFLKETYRVFRSSGRYVYTDWMSLAKDGKLELHECPNYDPALLFARHSIHAVTILIPKADFWAVEGFVEDMGAWEDVELYMKLAAHNYCGVRVAKPLFVYRYQTGSLREYGETIKPHLKQVLNDRYHEFIEGSKMCDCTAQEKARAQEIAAFTLPEDADTMRVKMDGAFAPLAALPIKGESGQLYGRRAKGDTFIILKRDLMSLSRYVTPYQEYTVAPPQTVIPPPPESVIERKAL